MLPLPIPEDPPPPPAAGGRTAAGDTAMQPPPRVLRMENRECSAPSGVRLTTNARGWRRRPASTGAGARRARRSPPRPPGTRMRRCSRPQYAISRRHISRAQRTRTAHSALRTAHTSAGPHGPHGPLRIEGSTHRAGGRRREKARQRGCLVRWRGGRWLEAHAPSDRRPGRCRLSPAPLPPSPPRAAGAAGGRGRGAGERGLRAAAGAQLS
jgi:hypothetical protein